MTSAQAVRLASRLVVLYLLFWVIADLVNLPRELLAVYVALRFPGLSATGTFYVRGQIIVLASIILEIALWSALALWFYGAGPRIQRFFGLADTVESQVGGGRPMI
jgi:hypothetical protein